MLIDALVADVKWSDPEEFVPQSSLPGADYIMGLTSGLVNAKYPGSLFARSSKQVSNQNTTATLTSAQIINGEITFDPADGSQVMTFPDAALLYAAMGSPPVNTSVSCQFINISDFIVTLAASDLIVANMPSLVLSESSTFDLNFVVTQVTPSLEISVLGGFAAGNVVGPSSATNNSLVRFDSNTGKLIKNSLATLDDSANLAIAGLSTNNNTKTAVFINGNDGVDETGNGSYNNPFLNPSYAISQITDASPTKPYVLFITGNISDPNQIYFSPNISFFAANSIVINNTLSVLADPAWETAASDSSAQWQNITFLNTVSLDFSAMTPSANPTGNFINCNFLKNTGGILINGWAAGDNPGTFMNFENCTGILSGNSMYYSGNDNTWNESDIAAGVQISGNVLISRNDYWNRGLNWNSDTTTGISPTRVSTLDMRACKVDSSALEIGQFQENNVSVRIVGCDIGSLILFTGGSGTFTANVSGLTKLGFLNLAGSATSTLTIDSASIPNVPFQFENDGLFTVVIADEPYNYTSPAPYTSSGTISSTDIINGTIVIPSGTAPITLDWGAAADIIGAFAVPLPDNYVELMIVNNSTSTVTLTNSTDPTNVGTIGLIGGNTKTQLAQTTLFYRFVIGNIITPGVGIFGG